MHRNNLPLIFTVVVAHGNFSSLEFVNSNFFQGSWAKR